MYEYVHLLYLENCNFRCMFKTTYVRLTYIILVDDGAHACLFVCSLVGSIVDVIKYVCVIIGTQLSKF